MLTKEILQKKFTYFKDKANSLLKKGKYNLAIDSAKVSCELAKRYNLSFADDALEKFAHELSANTLDITKDHYNGERIVFYDNIAVDNITLTQQYIRALINFDVEFLFLTARNLQSARSQKILAELINAPKTTIKMPDRKYTSTELMHFYKSSICDYKPSMALIHTQATDVEGVSLFHSFPHIKKYYIEMADHNFWLGTQMLDYCISFRSFGQNIAEKYRGISKEKIRIQPYYPIVDNGMPFAGFPPNTYIKNTVKILSGGRVSKIYDQNDTYLNFIKEILINHPNVMFYFIGSSQGASSGPVGYIHNFIKKNGLENQFHILSFRKDLIEIMKKMDIYIGTFPIGGGLMTQIAAYCNLPIVQYAMPGLSSSLIEFLSNGRDLPKVVFNDDLTGFMQEVNRLVEDESWRKTKGDALHNALLSSDMFNEQLKALIYNDSVLYNPEYYDIDVSNIMIKAIEAENLYMHQYQQILFKSKYYLKCHFLKYLFNLLQLFWYTDKKWFIKNMTKVLKLKIKKSWQ